MRSHNKIITFIVLLCFLIIGTFLGILIRDFPYISLKKEITVGEIPSFLLTLFIAMYIPFFINKEITNKRTEKDILIQACIKQENELQELWKLIDTAFLKPRKVEKNLARRILLKTRHISKGLSLIKEAISSYKSHKEITHTIDSLITNQLTCWDDLTFNLADRVPKLTEEKYLKVEDSLYKYSANIAQLVRYVNNT